MSLRKVIISGGGTGGHVFPAIAIADALKQKHPDIKILFVGAHGKLEMQKVPQACYEIIGLWISGFQRSLSVKNLIFPIKLLASLQKAWRILRKFKPDVVIGVGGYASGPLLKMASLANIPTVLQEQNSYPGVTNKLLAKKAALVCVAYEGMDKFFPASKLKLTGNPVRNAVVDIEGKKSEALKFFGLEEGKKVILAIGGSLGARTINQSLSKFAPDFLKENFQIIWQCGKQYEDKMTAEKAKFSKGFYINTFIERMDLAYAAADLIISRAGAISVSELQIVGKPLILIPSPNVAEDHQTKNAQSLVNKNAAILVKDAQAIDTLGNVSINLMKSEDLAKTLAHNIKQMAIKDAALQIADAVNEIVKE